MAQVYNKVKYISVSWVWCSLITFVCMVQIVFSGCFGYIEKLDTFPRGDINIRYGDPLEIYCSGNSSNNLSFQIGGKKLPGVTAVNDTAIKLYLAKPEMQWETYYCADVSRNLNCPNKILVDTPPRNVTKFSCTSYNLEYLNCTWIVPKSYAKATFELTYYLKNNGMRSCNVVQIGQMASCVWNSRTHPTYRQQISVYEFNLTSINVFGRNEQKFIVDHYANLIPRKPENLKVVHIETHAVILQWEISGNLIDFDIVFDYKIEYQIAKIDNLSYFRTVNIFGLPKKRRVLNYTLDLPYPHMKYEVRVYMKSSKANDTKESWSDFSFVIFDTASQPPDRPPETAVGGFVASTIGEHRYIYIYWKQLEEYEENGENFTYEVVIKQDDKIEIHYPQKNESMSYVHIYASLRDLDVSVKSLNSHGSSLNSSHLYIPAQEDILEGPTSFTKLAFENGTYELSWHPVILADNYTLFWCHHNVTQKCVGRLNFQTLEASRTNFVIQLQKFAQYQFAISANRGYHGSGMVWAKCDISGDNLVMYAVDVNLSWEAPSKTWVKLIWTLGCTIKNGTISGYNVTYCPETNNMCDDTVGQSSVLVNDPDIMEANITNLLPSRLYQFNLALITASGPRVVTKQPALVTTLADAPSEPINVNIYDIRNDSLIISWDPPLKRNGNMVKYLIYNNGHVIFTDTVENQTHISKRSVKLTGLDGFTNYSLSVKACNDIINESLCSNLSSSVFVRTAIGPSHQMNTPEFKDKNNKVIWDPPVKANGPICRYEIQKIIDGADQESYIYNMSSTELEFVDMINCDRKSHSNVIFKIRAITCDNDFYHGVWAADEIIKNQTTHNDSIEYVSAWSKELTYLCIEPGENGSSVILFSTLFIAFAIGMGYALVKIYKKCRKMEDIKAVLPPGIVGDLGKEAPKYSLNNWNSPSKDDKQSSPDEIHLLNSNNENKQECDSSNNTDSTTLSELSRETTERESSTSDEGSEVSMKLDVEGQGDKQGQDDVPHGGSESIPDKCLPSNSSNTKSSGYVQAPVTVPTWKNAPDSDGCISLEPFTTSSYVMAGLSPPIFTNSMARNIVKPNTSGYVCPEDARAMSLLNFSKMGSVPTNITGPESLPTMQTNHPLTTNQKYNTDGNTQLQSLDSIPSLKPVIGSTMPLKTPNSMGYVSPGDAVIKKHLNILSGGQLTEEPVILAPGMSLDAYCRFSWSTDPANDNLHSLLAESPKLDSTKD